MDFWNQFWTGLQGQVAAWIAGLALMFGCAGCGLTDKGYNQGTTSIGFSRLTGSGKITNNKDVNIKVGEISGNGAAKAGDTPARFAAKDVTVTDTASTVNAQLAEMNDSITRLAAQKGANAIGLSNSFWTGLVAETHELMALAPQAGALIGAWRDIGIAKANRPTLVSQLSGLVASGKVPVSEIEANDPGLAKEVVDTLKKNTTQP